MTTTFQDMRDLVNAQTKRPELVTLTDSAIRLATLRAHQVDFFSRDQASSVLTYTPPTTNEIFVDIPDIYTVVGRLRTPDFVHIEDLTTLLPTEQLEYAVDYKNFWNAENELKQSVFTLLGTSLRIRAYASTGRCRFYYYLNPVVSSVGYSSWIADEYPEELALWAAAIIWMRSGFQEIANSTQRDIIVPFKDMLVTSHLTSKV